MTPTFHNSASTLSPNFLWKKSEMIDEIKEHKALIVFFGVNTIFLVKFELLDKSNTMTRCSRVILNIFHTFNEMRYGHWQQFSCWHQRWENPTFRKKLLKTNFQIKDKYKQSTPWLRVYLILFPKPIRTVAFQAQPPPQKKSEKGVELIALGQFWDFFWVVKTCQVPVAQTTDGRRHTADGSRQCGEGRGAVEGRG